MCWSYITCDADLSKCLWGGQECVDYWAILLDPSVCRVIDFEVADATLSWCNFV